jgi:hypothetical protein
MTTQRWTGRASMPIESNGAIAGTQRIGTGFWADRRILDVGHGS